MKHTYESVVKLNILYQSGLNANDVCKQTQIARGSFSYLMRKFGFTVRPKGFQPGNNTKSQFKLGEQTIVVCVYCDNEFIVSKWETQYRNGNGRKYCSQSCAKIHLGKNQRGENHPNWKGGISTKWDKLHNSKEYQAWRLSVWQRDCFKCQHCKCGQSVANPLNAHHIKPKAKFPNLILDIENGLTLCRNCHKVVHYGNAGRHG